MKRVRLLVPAFLAITFLPNAPLMAQQPGQDPGDQKCDVPPYKGNEVDKKLRILDKPEPDFSAQERRQHAHQKVILTTVFCGSGAVTKIRVKSGISDRVNAKALEAARKNRFLPGDKDGKKVSQWLILEYHVQ
jgi:outer membrane biosynthesis protein TonB